MNEAAVAHSCTTNMSVILSILLVVAGIPCIPGRSLRAAEQDERLQSLSDGASKVGDTVAVPIRHAGSDGVNAVEARVAFLEGQSRQAKLEWMSGAESQTLVQQQAAVQALASEERRLVAKEWRLEKQQRDLQARMKSLAAKRGTGQREDPLESVGTSDEEVREVGFQAWASENHKIGIAAYIIFILVCAILYTQYLRLSYVKIPHDDLIAERFQHSLMDCRNLERDWQICLCAWVFPTIRWADTVSVRQVRFLPFWPALLIFLFLRSTVTASLGASGLICLIMVVFARQKIRQTYDIPAWSVSTIAGDCAVWLFCSPCAIVQEARQIELVEPNPNLSTRFKSPVGPDGPLHDPSAPQKESWEPYQES